MRPLTIVPEQKRVDELLHEMRRTRTHIAVVVDEYGGSTGVITIEDLLEVIVGEIQDERDNELPKLQRIGPNLWRVPARTEIEALALAIDHAMPDGEYETVAGLILHHLGRIPLSGQIVVVEELRFQIEQANERSIQWVHLSLVTKSDTEQSSKQ